jgi:predicted transcriptional regulator
LNFILLKRDILKKDFEAVENVRRDTEGVAVENAPDSTRVALENVRRDTEGVAVENAPDSTRVAVENAPDSTRVAVENSPASADSAVVSALGETVAVEKDVPGRKNALNTPSANALNSERFTAAYNKIDKKLRRLYSFNANQSFSEVVRKCAGQNYIVKRNEDSLLDYARLRNAIIHSGGKVIAEPNLEAVEELEKICRQIVSPPLALKKIANKRVDSLSYNTTLRDAVIKMTNTRHSHLPVLRDGKIVGIINGKTITRAIGAAIREGSGDGLDGYINRIRVGEILEVFDGEPHYNIAKKNATIDALSLMFESNRKLKLVFITANGTSGEEILGVIAVTDILNFNAILNDY